MKKLLISGFVLSVMGAALFANAKNEPSSGAQMITTARAFLESLDDNQRKAASFGYDDAERLNWHFIPRERKGLPLRDLRGNSLAAAQRFIASGLSSTGYEQAVEIMSLEEILYLLEGGDRAERRERRDPKKYYLSVFGKPGEQGTWGWRVEGHHLSLNYSIKDGEIVATTPEFFGANPAVVDAGPERFVRVLGTEEDLARQILTSCTPEQQKKAWIEKKAPDDLRGANKPQAEISDAAGLSAAEMTKDQKQLLAQLLSEYLKNMPADVEMARRGRIESAGLGEIRFAWWGDSEKNKPHYYRVQGPTFIIEFNNTQNNANHVHSMWRDLSGDFNILVKKGGA